MLSQIQRSLQCTERLNDPVILLGVLCRMRKLELLGQNLKYSSPEFAKEMLELSNDVSDSIKVNLGGRTGERNIIRNSSQYWRAVGLIPNDRSGRIQLRSLGVKWLTATPPRLSLPQSQFKRCVCRTLKFKARTNAAVGTLPGCCCTH